MPTIFHSNILPVQTVWICCYKHWNNHNCWTITHSTPKIQRVVTPCQWNIIFMSRKSIISLVVLLKLMLLNYRESRGPNCNTPHWIRNHFCFTKKAKSARMSQHLSVTQPVINTWLHYFLNDKINTFFILCYSNIFWHHSRAKREKIQYENDASMWSATYLHARQTSFFHWQEYFNWSHFGQKSITEMRHIFI